MDFRDPTYYIYIYFCLDSMRFVEFEPPTGLKQGEAHGNSPDLASWGVPVLLKADIVLQPVAGEGTLTIIISTKHL